MASTDATGKDEKADEEERKQDGRVWFVGQPSF
jgi:hypothetical protein